MYATLFLIAVAISVLVGVLLARKWMSNFGDDDWTEFVSVGAFGFFATLWLFGGLAMIVAGFVFLIG